MLAAIAIIGVVTFLAIPNIVRVKEDSEDNLARSRASALNVAIASYVQSVGPSTASNAWAAADNGGRYNLVRPYVAFSESTLAGFQPSGYAFVLPTTVTPVPLTKTTVSNTSKGTLVDY